MLTLSHVSKSYGKFPAVEDISLEMEHGLYGMLAPNGAGKTTLIKMIATLLVPTQGEILWDGIPVAKLGEKYRDLLGYLPQQFGYYKNNTPVQYLDYLAALKNMPKQTAKEKIEQLLELVGLSDVADKKMKKFSGGMIQRVGIAQAMLNDPKILILDEPTAGLDPKERARFRNILSTLSKDRIVILSTHIVSDIESNANQVILLKERKLYRMDTVSNICKTLDGKVYECVMEDRAFDAFQDTHLILSVRQEQEHMQVRYYSSKPEEGSRNWVNFAGLYGNTSMRGWHSIKLPPNMTWEGYLDFLLKTLPENTRKNYQRKLSVSMNFWRDKGGCLADETIRKLEKMGIPITVGDHSNYRTEKKPVRMEYLDDIDIPEFKELPTFKRMCICILKNDHTCKYMGFSLNKAEKEQKERVMEKYKALI